MGSVKAFGLIILILLKMGEICDKTLKIVKLRIITILKKRGGRPLMNKNQPLAKFAHTHRFFVKNSVKYTKF